MEMRNYIFRGIAAAVAVFTLQVALNAQRTGVREEVLDSRELGCGLDRVYDFSAVDQAGKIKGYEPFYVSHYGRHGSRYAYSPNTYKNLLDMLVEAEAQDNITAYGKELKTRLSALYEKVRYRVGDLTDRGWEQQKKMAAGMVTDYPSAFGKGSEVTACASSSIRSIMSMTSFCTELSRRAPKSEIIAHQGLEYIQFTAPNMGKNPFRYKGPESVFPYSESPLEFMQRRFPEYRNMLGRMFVNPEKAVGDRDLFWTIDYIYMLAAGMNSLDEGVQADLSDIFTPEEFAAMWEVDNYMRFEEYYKYRTSCSSIIDDIVDKADARIASGSEGADLRFGHDHCLLTLFMIGDIDHFGHFPANADDLVYWFQTFRSPMAGNLQFVFYRPKRRGSSKDILVKVLLNGQIATVGDISPDDEGIYRWSDVRAFLKARTASFTIK